MSKTQERRATNEVSTDDELCGSSTAEQTNQQQCCEDDGCSHKPPFLTDITDTLTGGVERDGWNISEKGTVFYEEDEDLFMLVHDSVECIEGSANTINLTEYSEPTVTYTARLTDSDVAERVLVVEGNGQAHNVNLSLYRELCKQVNVDWEDAKLTMADMYGAHPVGVRVNSGWTMYIAPIIGVGIESGSKEKL